MADPLVELDPAGKANTLNYNIPEPISYSGKHYIDLSLSAQTFITPVSPLPSSSSGSGAIQPSGTGGKTASGGAKVTPIPAQGDAADAPALKGWSADGLVASRSTPVLSPPGVVVALSGSEPAVKSAVEVTDRLGALTGIQARELVSRGQLVVFPNTMGRLDYRIVNAQPIDTGGGGVDGVVPDVYIGISSPTDGSKLASKDAKLQVTILGSCSWDNVTNVRMMLSVDGEAPMPLSSPDGDTWKAELEVDSAGSHMIKAQILATARRPVTGTTYDIQSQATATVNVTLGSGAGPGVVPSVAITNPTGPTIKYSKVALNVTVSGTSAPGSPGIAVTSVRLTDSMGGPAISIPVNAAGGGAWSSSVLLSGPGTHVMSAIAVDSAGSLSQTATVTITVVPEQGRVRQTNRLMLVETLNISSFLGEFGAGRCLKTLTLLPGEKMQISVKTWTKSVESTKSGSSILDSSNTDAEDSWEQSLAQEQTSKEALTEASQYKISADASACWGWGHADVRGEYTGSANSTREGAIRNVRNALQKHSLKASTNRSVTINSEYTASSETGEEESTTREISNINVSRVLNFVFRQMNQEHIILIHLTNVRVAFYSEDVLLDTNGNVEYIPVDPADPKSQLVPHIVSTYEEVSLADLESLLFKYIGKDYRDGTIEAIKNALSGIPDYQDNLQTVFEVVVPKKGGVDVPAATYMRFPRGLTMKYPPENPQFEVSGVILAVDNVVMRTDAVLCDAFLGEGVGLDQYSQDLQQVSIDERRSKVAREELAQRIVENKDEAMAALFAKLFPQPQTPVTTTTTTTSDGTGG